MRSFLTLALLLVPSASPRAETFRIDPNHSSVMFKIRHIIGKVPGHFDKFEGSFDYAEGKPQSWKAQAKIEAASINTGIDKRDEHLRSDAFFDVQRCPTLEFKSTKVEVKGGKTRLLGDLTMRCVTKPVALDLDVSGAAVGPDGRAVAGATLTGKVNRQDFGVKWNRAIDKGGYVLGDEVEVSIEVEGIAQPH